MKGNLKPILSALFAAILSLSGCCAAGKAFYVYQFDNGDDYFCEGLQRIVDAEGRIGFADRKGRVVISPRFAFAFPFEDGKARVTFSGHSEGDGEHSWWVSSEWVTIGHDGNILPPEQTEPSSAPISAD